MLKAINETTLQTLQGGVQHLDDYKIFALQNDLYYLDLFIIFKKYHSGNHRIWTDLNVKSFLSESPAIIKMDGTKYFIHKITDDGTEGISSLVFDQTSNSWLEQQEKENIIFQKNSLIIEKGQQQMTME